MSSTTNMLKKMAALATIGIMPDRRTVYRSFGSSPKTIIVFQGPDKVQRFDELMKEIWEEDQNLYRSISQQAIERLVVRILRTNLEKSTEISDAQVTQEFTTLRALPEIEREIFQPLYGVSEVDPSPLVLGPFVVINMQENLAGTSAEYPKISSILNEEFNAAIKRAGTKTFVSTKFCTRDNARAEELAMEAFETFDNVINYMWPYRSREFDFGILNYRGLTNRRVLILNANGISIGDRLQGAVKQCPFTSVFVSPRYGYKCVWDIIEKARSSTLTEMQKRIMMAVDWIGKGTRETDDTKAIIQFMFAIEALLSGGEGVITPAICYQLAESMALLLGKNYETKAHIEQEIKRLYKLRSGIAHGRDIQCTREDVKCARSYAREIAIKISTTGDLMAISTFKELRDYLKRCKYT